MNSQAKWVLALCILSCSLLPSAAEAQTATPAPRAVDSPGKSPVRPLSEPEVVSLSLQHNPDLSSAMLSEKQAMLAVRSEEARYPFMLQANAGFTHTTSPALGPGGTVITSTRDSVVLGSTLSKDFATGTNVRLSFQGERNATNRAVGANVTAGNAGTGYALSSRLAVTQPLLQGAGTRIGESGLRAARLDATAKKEARHRVTSEVLRDVLSAYWELWYASRSMGIEISARDLAAAQRDEAEARKSKGALPAADVLAFDSRLASLDEQVTAAELTELERGLDLAQILGVEAPQARWQATGDPGDPASPSVTDVENKLAERSPELHELQAKLEAAESRAQVAGDVYRPRLDVEGYVEVRGLGNGSIAPAFGQIGALSAVGGYVGMVFEAPLGMAQESAEVEKARAEVRIAKNQLDAAKNRLRLSAAKLVAQLDASRARRAAAEQTAAIAARQLEAEAARYALGASTPIQVQAAEDAVRQARLRVARARVDQVKAALAIEHSTGELIARYAATMPNP
jgi:outer membrane protein